MHINEQDSISKRLKASGAFTYIQHFGLGYPCIMAIAKLILTVRDYMVQV